MKKDYSTTEQDLFIRLNNLRGLLAVIVLLSHIWGYTGIRLLVPFNKVVTIAVACFFFLSGYGMMRSYGKKKNYTKEIFCVKIPYLVWMAVFAYVFSAVLELILVQFGHQGSNFWPLGLRQFIVSTNWYVYELIGFYIVFAVCMKFVSQRYQLIFMTVVSAVAFVLLYHSGLVEAYYNSIIGFVVGMVCGRKDYVSWMKRFKKGYLAAFFLLILSFGGMFVLDRTTIWFAAVRNIAAAAAIIAALYFIRYVDTCDRVNHYLSRISPEIYFYHMPIALLLRDMITNTAVYIVVVIVMTMTVSPVISILNKRIQKKIKTCIKA